MSVFVTDFVFAYMRRKIRTRVTGMTTLSRSRTRTMFSHWPLQTREYPVGTFTLSATAAFAFSTKRPTSSFDVSKST